MNAPADSEVELPPPPSALRRFLPMIGLLIGGVALGAGGALGLSGMLGEESVDTAMVEEEGEVEDIGGIHSLGRITVNLAGSGGTRVLRMEVALRTADLDAESVAELEPVLRDGVIAVASDYSYADIEGLDGKTRLRDELLARVNALIDTGRVDAVLFTQFVVQ